MMKAPALLHRMPSNELEEVRVSSQSMWNDESWSFSQTTAGRHSANARFGFRLQILDETDEYESETLMDDRFATLLDEVRRFVYSMIVDARGYGGRLKTTGISNLQTETHFFLRWMVGQGYTSIGDIPPSAMEEYVDHVIREKVRDGDEDSLTDRALAKYLAIPIKLHEQCKAMPEGVSLLRDQPYGGKPAIQVARRIARKAVAFIPAVPMGVYLPVMAEALSWVHHKSWDIKHIHDEVMDAWNSADTRSSGQKRAETVLRRMSFRTMAGDSQPWRSPITGTIVTQRRGPDQDEGRVGMFQQLRRLLLDAREASVTLIQGLVALRISEICGLQSEPFDHDTGLPACVMVEPTLNGIYDAFYIVGRVYKGQDGWEEVRWAAGLRPRGADVIPPAIQAILALHHVFKPYRDMAGLGDLVLNFTSAAGLPKNPATVVPCPSNALNRGQQWWVREYCPVPADTAITTHMWRKTYGVHLYKADPSLLPAISMHFKHIDTQTTYEGYIRNADPDLLMMIDEISMSQDAEMFREIRHGRIRASGGLYDTLVEGHRQSADFLDGLTDEQEAQAIRDEIVNAGIRSHECGWGRCLYRPEWSRCGGGTYGPSDSGRSPTTCAGCQNLIVLDEHRIFWNMRRETNRKLADQHIAAGKSNDALVPLDRVAQCDTMLGMTKKEVADV